MVDFSALSERGRQFFASRKRRNWTGAALVFILLFLVVRGCGSSAHDRHFYNVGQDESWKGLNLMGKERNLSAFNIDLLTAIAKQENIYIKVNSFRDNELMRLLNGGELEAILSDLQPTLINQSVYTFSDPYFMLGPVLIISSQEPLKGWNEMAVKIVGVPSNLQALLNLDNDPTMQVKLYDNILRALADLDERRIDGVIFPALPAYIYTNTFYEGRLKIATPPLTEDGLRLIALKNQEGRALVEAFNKGLKDLKDNGLYDQLLTQWGLINIEKTD